MCRKKWMRNAIAKRNLSRQLSRSKFNIDVVSDLDQGLMGAIEEFVGAKEHDKDDIEPPIQMFIEDWSLGNRKELSNAIFHFIKANRSKVDMSQSHKAFRGDDDLDDGDGYSEALANEGVDDPPASHHSQSHPHNPPKHGPTASTSLQHSQSGHLDTKQTQGSHPKVSSGRRTKRAGSLTRFDLSGTTNINTSKGSSSGASAIKQQHHQQQRGRSSSSASLGGGGGRLHRSDSNVSHNHANVNDENDDDRALPVLPAKKALGVSSGVVGGGLGSGKVAMAVASPTGSYHADLLPVMQGDQDD
mmetsp:Transcript_48950/g.122643  ORF Transcript_48950/g.122643 Transcript_48950/m.122643 type:complete len:302 (+) Transcript_48950:94-999(+)